MTCTASELEGRGPLPLEIMIKAGGPTGAKKIKTSSSLQPG
jgi:hypothetical protein